MTVRRLLDGNTAARVLAAALACVLTACGDRAPEAASAEGGRWVLADQADFGTTYLDDSSFVRTDSSKYAAWMEGRLTTPDSNIAGPSGEKLLLVYRYQLRYEFDCAARRRRALEVVAIDLSGQRLTVQTEPDPWDSFPPYAPIAKVFTKACQMGVAKQLPVTPLQ